MTREPACGELNSLSNPQQILPRPRPIARFNDSSKDPRWLSVLSWATA